MDPRQISARLPTRFLGKTIVHFSRVASTNTVAKGMAERGAPEGTLVLADYQTAGHGRRGRVWLAAPGEALLVSIVLRPTLAPADIFYLTMAPSLAALEAVETAGTTGASLKWPNDVQIAGRKVAGILAEVSLRGPKLGYAVIGLGLNVNLDVSRYPEIAALATSLSHAVGRPVDREDVISTLLPALERRYLALERGEGAAVFEEWRARLTTLGQWVDVSDGGPSYLAFAEDVTPDGGLVLRRDGQRHVVYGGDVTLAKSPR